MDASCGPTNALAQFSKHTQRDTSLQHERQHFAGQNEQNAFRNGPGLDANLNVDFQRFNQGNSVDFQPQGFHAQQFHGQPMANSINASENIGFRGENGQGWVLDFRGLSLEGQGSNQVQNRMQNAGPKSDWHRQFMQKMQLQNLQGQQNFQGQQQYNVQNLRGNMGQQQFQPQQQFQTQFQQHDNLNLMDFDEQALAKEFDMVEQELELHAQENEVQQMPELDNETEKEQFAAAARQVQQSMMSNHTQQSQETAQKFQQSGFLKLMTQILDREVEISNDGEKLVSKTTGEDIRQYLSDPLKHEREDEQEPEYQTPLKEFVTHGLVPQPQVQEKSRATNESANIRSHLPDPLAHIRDGALDGDLSLLQAAQVISGGQVQGDSWMEDGMWDSMDQTRPRTGPSLLSAYEQEVYDDYRNDDY